MTRREYMPGQVGGGISSFQGVAQPGAPTVRPTDYSGIRSALDAWAVDTFQQREAEVMQQVTDRALRAQQELGAESVAESDRAMARRYEQRFNETAELIFLQQLSVDALKMDTQLRQQHQFDPDGYANAWAEYSEHSIGKLRDENIRLFSAGKEMLDQQGTRTWAGISNAAFQRAEIEQKAASLRNTQETIDVYSDRIRDPNIDNDQRDIEYTEGVTAATVNLMGLLDANIIDGAEFERMLQDAGDVLRTEWVTANFQAAMVQGDLGAARGYIDELRQGRWYVDNSKADALASRLEASIPNLDAQYKRTLKRLAQAEASMLANGVAPSEEAEGAIAYYVQWAAAQGDEDALFDALSVQSGLNAKLLVNSMSEMNINAIQFARNTVAADTFMPDGDRTALVNAADAVLEQYNAAIRTGDAQILRNLNPYATAEEVAGQFNVDPDILPTFSTQQVSDAFQLAKNSGQGIQVLMPLLEEAAFNGASAGDLAHTAMKAASYGEMDSGDAAAFSMAVMALGSGLPHLATRAIADADFTTTDPNLAKVNYVNRMTDTKAHQAISAMAMGNPELRTALRNAVNNMFRAEIARHEGLPQDSQEKAAATAIQQELKALPVVQVGGASYPQAMFGAPDESNVARERIRQIGELIDADAENTGMHHRIEPDGSGGYFVFRGDSRANLAFVWADDLVEGNRERMLLSQANRRDAAAAMEQDTSWLDNYKNVSPFLQSQQQRVDFSQRVTTAARNNNVPAELARRLAIAAATTPDEQRAGRVGQLALPQSVLGARFTRSDIDTAMQIFAELYNKYDGDEKKTLAAYWAGPSVFDSLLDAYGDEWFDLMSSSTREFVYRALDADPGERSYVTPDALRNFQILDPRHSIGIE